MYLTQLVTFTVYDNLWRRCVYHVYFAWFMVVSKKGSKKQSFKTIFTLSYSQLPDSWHANQNGNFVTNVHCVVLVVTVVPVRCIDSRCENVRHPSPESYGVSNLKISKKTKLDGIENRQPSLSTKP